LQDQANKIQQTQQQAQEKTKFNDEELEDKVAQIIAKFLANK
jgi:hypothetical protein